MPHYTRILSVGRDHYLLSLRSMVLESAGFDLIEAYSVADALRLAQSDAVDLVLICHSVPKPEQKRLIAAIRERRRLMPVLCVIAHDFAMAADSCTITDHAPQLLLDALHKALVNYSSYRPNLAA